MTQVRLGASIAAAGTGAQEVSWALAVLWGEVVTVRPQVEEPLPLDPSLGPQADAQRCGFLSGSGSCVRAGAHLFIYRSLAPSAPGWFLLHLPTLIGQALVSGLLWKPVKVAGQPQRRPPNFTEDGSVAGRHIRPARSLTACA